MAEKVSGLEQGGSALAIRMTDGSVAFDAAALVAITDQARGESFQLSLRSVGAEELNPAQRAAIEDLSVGRILDAQIISGGKSISDFRGGSAVLSVPLSPEEGRLSAGMAVWYVDGQGARTQIPTVRSDREIRFQAAHFSNYVIAYTDLVTASGVGETLRTGEHTAYLTGYEDGTVRPEQEITRAETAMIFFRLLRDPGAAEQKSFPDVLPGLWYTEAVETLAGMGILNGRENGSFDPDTPITRAEFVAIAARFAYAVEGGTGFPDIPENHWAASAISTAAAGGWVRGCEDGLFHPERRIRRGEAATILNRMLGRSPEQREPGGIEPDFSSFSDLQDPAQWYYPELAEACGAYA